MAKTAQGKSAKRKTTKFWAANLRTKTIAKKPSTQHKLDVEINGVKWFGVGIGALRNLIKLTGRYGSRAQTPKRRAKREISIVIRGTTYTDKPVELAKHISFLIKNAAQQRGA